MVDVIRVKINNWELDIEEGFRSVPTLVSLRQGQSSSLHTSTIGSTNFNFCIRIIITSSNYTQIIWHFTFMSHRLWLIVMTRFENFDCSELKAKFDQVVEILNPGLNRTENGLSECRICLNESSMAVFIPCGHTACNDCTKKLNKTCHTCRQKFTNTVRLYQ